MMLGRFGLFKSDRYYLMIAALFIISGHGGSIPTV